MFDQGVTWTLDGEARGIQLLWGGAHQRGRVALVITGDGSALLEDPARREALSGVLERSRGRITRMDVAVDFWHGEISPRDAQAAWFEDRASIQAGGKASNWVSSKGGRCPFGEGRGDWWGSGRGGLTWYVGKRESGKLCRVYDKGAQLRHQIMPRWVRAEVQFGTRDRELLPCLLVGDNALRLWLGAYPILRRWWDQHSGASDVRALRIPTGRRDNTIVADAGRAIRNLAQALVLVRTLTTAVPSASVPALQRSLVGMMEGAIEPGIAPDQYRGGRGSARRAKRWRSAPDVAVQSAIWHAEEWRELEKPAHLQAPAFGASGCVPFAPGPSRSMGRTGRPAIFTQV